MDNSSQTKTIAEKALGATATAKDAVANASANARESTQTAAVETRSFLERNPLGLAIGSIAVGFLVGLALPMSDLEREKVAPFSDKFTQQAKGAASDFVTQGKTVVLEAVTTALKPSAN